MKTDLAQIKWSFIDGELGQTFRPFAFTFVTDFKISARSNLVTASRKHKRALLERYSMQRNPSCNGLSCRQRPVELVHVPGGMATATLLAESLIMIDRDAMSPEQIGRDSCQPFAEDEVPDDLVLQPKICDLEKCLPISGARFEWRHVLALCPGFWYLLNPAE
jgi:hypothetical protein